MSSSHPLFDVATAPRYVKVSTSSRVSPSILICSQILELSLITLVFLMFILSPTSLAFSCSDCVFRCMYAMPSEKSRSSNLPVEFHLMPVGYLSSVLFITECITNRNKNPDIMHPNFIHSCCYTEPLLLHLLTLHIKKHHTEVSQACLRCHYA